MAKDIDFAAIKRQVPIAKVADYLGLPATSKDQIRCECPACESDNPRGLAVTKSIGSYYCHVEKRGGDCIGLLAHIRGIGQREAAEIIMRDLMGNSTDTRNSTATASRRAPYSTGSRRKQPQEPKQEPAAIGLTELEYLQHEHEAVQELGISPEDAEALGIGYAPRGIMRGLVAVPIRLGDGKLAGYIGLPDDPYIKLPTRWHHINVVPLKRRA